MKVVLFCGGLGMRLRDFSDQIPKPMVPVGRQPIIWHLMKYYAHYGHRDFILCLGYKGQHIKQFLQNPTADAADNDSSQWRITFVDTGATTNIGGRLMAVRHHLQEDQEFLANYTDTLSDLHLDDVIGGFRASAAIGAFVAVRPNISSHIITADDAGMVESIGRAADAELWSNGGYFAFRNEIFDYIREGDELVEEPFARLIRQKKLYAHKYRGFWTSMDTFKEKQQLDDLHAQGSAPWEVWKHQARR